MAVYRLEVVAAYARYHCMFEDYESCEDVVSTWNAWQAMTETERNIASDTLHLIGITDTCDRSELNIHIAFHSIESISFWRYA